MKHELVAMTVAGLMLAQMSSYNGGIPVTPGTSVPESNPATAIAPSRAAPPSGSPAAGPAIGSGAGASTAPAGPAYSFGAAPPPTISVPSH
ncbi:MAG TPA: hypothetical protein VME45_01460 [Stellaceae bacterium]|nr:hypothetical protein [Stellaceae bacterium]